MNDIDLHGFGILSITAQKRKYVGKYQFVSFFFGFFVHLQIFLFVCGEVPFPKSFGERLVCGSQSGC